MMYETLEDRIMLTTVVEGDEKKETPIHDLFFRYHSLREDFIYLDMHKERHVIRELARAHAMIQVAGRAYYRGHDALAERLIQRADEQLGQLETTRDYVHGFLHMVYPSTQSEKETLEIECATRCIDEAWRSTTSSRRVGVRDEIFAGIGRRTLETGTRLSESDYLGGLLPDSMVRQSWDYPLTSSKSGVYFK